MIVSLVFLEHMLDAIRVVDQVSGPEKEAYPNDITVVPGHFQSKTQRVVPDISRTPKQEMTGRSWYTFVVRQFCFPLLTSALVLLEDHQGRSCRCSSSA